MTPQKLASKVVAGIIKKPGVTYQRLQEHALSLNIPLGIFENAMQLVHKNKTIQAKLKGGVIIYVVREIAGPKAPLAHVTWCNENYPWPDNFIMPWPEWDLSYIFMKPDEAKAYHAAAKGKSLFTKKKKYEYARR